MRFSSIFVVTLTLNFQRQIWNLLYLSPNWSGCHETKSKHVDWTLGLKCDHRVWPGPWPWPWIFKVKYGICYISAKNGSIATKRKENISIDPKASNVTIGFDLGHDLDLHFSRSNMEFAISLPKMFQLPRNKKQTYRLNSKPQMWPSDLTSAMTLTLNFQGLIWNLLHLKQKWSDCHETKSKHIDWSQGLKCDQWVWPWPWPWPLNFQGRVKCDLHLWPHTWLWPRIFVVRFWNSCISKWEGLLTLNKGGGSRSFMTMTVTIWWPRSGVRIYQIVNGVTSDAGVPSTHLVSNEHVPDNVMITLVRKN